MKPKTTGEEIVSMQIQMLDIQKDIGEIKSDIKSILANLAATSTQNAILSNEIDDLQKTVTELKKKSGLWGWLGPTLAAVAGSILTFLLISYIQSFAK